MGISEYKKKHLCGNQVVVQMHEAKIRKRKYNCEKVVQIKGRWILRVRQKKFKKRIPCSSESCNAIIIINANKQYSLPVTVVTRAYW